MAKTVLCMAKTQAQAHTIIDRLEHAGIESKDVSLVMADHSVKYGHVPNSEDLLKLLTGIGKITMPHAGFFVVAGPLLTVIRDTPKSTLEGVAGALVHFGFPEYEASRLQDMVKSGAILLSFHTPDNDEANRIREILENTDAEDISIAGEEDLTGTHHFMRSLRS